MQEQVTPTNRDSILESTKKLLGLPKEYDAFDVDIIIHANTVFSTLTQMGVGPKEGFTITGYDELWNSYTTTSDIKTQQVKSYLYLKVRSMFDPPSNGNLMTAMDKAIAELEYRLYTEEGGY